MTMPSTSDRDRISTALLLLRAGVFVVMLMWTLGGAELLLVLAFGLGLWKRATDGAVLMPHAVSTLSSYRQYLDPFDNLLFFAAWPMLAACAALYLLRDLDTRWTPGASR